MLFKSRNSRHNILEQKTKSLNTYVKQFNKAVSSVTSVVDKLTCANEGIERTVAEIKDYQQALDNTALGPMEAKSRNERVIENFNALLSSDREVI